MLGGVSPDVLQKFLAIASVLIAAIGYLIRVQMIGAATARKVDDLVAKLDAQEAKREARFEQFAEKAEAHAEKTDQEINDLRRQVAMMTPRAGDLERLERRSEKQTRELSQIAQAVARLEGMQPAPRRARSVSDIEHDSDSIPPPIRGVDDKKGE